MLICVEENCACFQHQFFDVLELDLKAKIKSLVEQPNKLRKLRDKSGLTLLHHSVKCGNVEMTEHLIEEEWKVNARDTSGVTPLMLAVKARNVKSAEVLLQNNADIYISDFDGESSLEMKPLDQRCRFILEMIFNNVVNNDFSEGKLTKFLSNANNLIKLAIVSFGNVEISRFVLENGYYSINYQEPQRQYTAIHCSMLLARCENVKLLIERGANINVLDKYGCSPFYNYSRHFEKVDENKKVLKHFLKHSCRLSSRNWSDGYTEMEVLLTGGTKKTVKAVLESGINVNACINENQSLPKFLVHNKHANVLELLDELNECDLNDISVLLDAVVNGWPEKLEFLLQYDVYVDAVTRLYGYPVFKYLRYNSFHPLEQFPKQESDVAKVIALLLQYGVDDDIQSYFSEKRNVPFCLPTKIIVAHLAMLGAVEQSSLTETTRQIIQSKPQLKDYFDLCTIQLDEMKDLEVYGTVTLFKLLTEEEENIAVYARNQEFITAWTDVIDNNSSHLEMYYSSTLQRKFTKASATAELQAKAAHAIEILTGLNSDVYRSIVFKIISYLARQDLYNLCEMESSFYAEASK